MSTTFTRDDIARLGHLARLQLTDEETDRFAAQLARILEYAEQLQQVDTRDVPPTSHAHEAGGDLRDDTPRPSLSREDVLRNAPEADPAAGLFKVPRVLG